MLTTMTACALRRALVIANPCAGAGRVRALTGDVLAALRQAGADAKLQTTEEPGHAARLAARAAADGLDALVCLGGDGTVNEVVDGVLGAGPWPAGLRLGPLPLGTGNAFVRDFGLRSGQWREALDRLIAGATRRIDAAVARPDSGPARHFVNVFGSGYMARVADVTNRRFKALGGSGYTAGVLWELARLAAPPTRLTLHGPDGEATIEAPLAMVAVCNTQWTGETMWIAPSAAPTDGVLDVITVGNVSRLELVRTFPKIFKGTHLEHPLVSAYRATRIRIEPTVDSPLLIDGEVIAQTPVTVDVLPAALTVAL